MHLLTEGPVIDFLFSGPREPGRLIVFSAAEAKYTDEFFGKIRHLGVIFDSPLPTLTVYCTISINPRQKR